MQLFKHYKPLATSVLFLTCSYSQATAITNVEVSSPNSAALTNVTVISESKNAFRTDTQSDSYIVPVGAPYLEVTDDKKGTITSEIFQNHETTTVSYKSDYASGAFNLNTNAAGVSVFKFNTTVTFDPTLSKQSGSGYTDGSFSMGISGSVVGGGSVLSEFPGLTSYQSPVWAFSINGGAYQQLATYLSVGAGYFNSGTSIDLYSLVGDLLPDSTANLSFMVYTNQDFDMGILSYSYTSNYYDYKTETTNAPKLLQSISTTYPVAAVPEVDSYAMLTAGLVLIGLVRRKTIRNERG